MKIAILENKAYWIHKHNMYEADVLNDNIIKNTTKNVDAFNLPLSQVINLMEVVDSLLEEDEEEE